MSMPRRVDIHCHCLCGIDDGPPTMEDSLALCRALVADGFTDVIATPHMLGRYDGANNAAQIRSRVAQLQTELDSSGIALQVHPGGEVRVDERIPGLLADGRILTLADHGAHLLIELSTTAYIEPPGLLAFLQRELPQVQVILAHAERYPALQRDPAAAQHWLERGAVLQVNADAFATPLDRSPAMEWLRRGWIGLVATDAHSTGSRRPRMREAYDAIRSEVGPKWADVICVQNPLRVLDGSHIAARPTEPE